MIHYVVPWKTGNIGGGINDAIAAIAPGRNDWICVRDGDTMFLTSQWGRHIEQIVDKAMLESYELVGCMTNRLRAAYQLHLGYLDDDPAIGNHVQIANWRGNEFGANIEEIPTGPIAGMFMLFPRRVWEREPFAERSIYFDQEFTASVRRSGGKVGVALGLYLFHLYRWGKADPFGSKDHLT
jgi:hypothetical protein